MLWWLSLSKSVKIAIIAGIVIVALAGYIRFLQYKSEVSTRQAEAANAEANRRAQESEGLKILINANNGVAKEVEDAKKLGNAQRQNINVAANNYNNSVKRDSNSYDGSVSDNEFCIHFCEDSTCENWRARHKDFFCRPR